MEQIVIVGSSGHAKVVIDIVERLGRFTIAGLVDGFKAVGEKTLGYPVLGSEADLPRLIESHGLQGCLVAIGDNAVRARMAAGIAASCPDLPFLTVVHPSAIVGRDVDIGPGTVVMAGVTINPSCKIGKLCILNTMASLDHDSRMDDFSSLAPGVITGGNCHIGTHSAIGIGAIVRHGITVGDHTVIGAGSTVVSDIGGHCVAYGVPARAIRKRSEGEQYL
jgi:sugar O-acyltransferase (sialic acid O-acetyltransferase NeuD family)